MEQPETTAPQSPTPSDRAKPSFKAQPLYEIAHELPALLVQHSAEVDDGQYPLDVDWDAYFAMALVGQLRFLTARVDDVLVGYIANIVRPHLRFKTTLHCFIEAYWLSPVYREGWAPVRMFRENDRLLKEWGVKRAYVAVEDQYKGGKANVLFERLGYHHAAQSFIKDFP